MDTGRLKRFATEARNILMQGVKNRLQALGFDLKTGDAQEIPQEMEADAANLSPRERKQLDNIVKQIEECREYHDRLHVIADKQIAFDLDDGVVVNYAKFGDVLAKIK